MNTLKLYILVISVLLLTVSPGHASIIYSGLLDLQGPNFHVDINKDGNVDFDTRWEVRIMGHGFAQSSYDTGFNPNMNYIHNRLTGFPPFLGPKTPLHYGDFIGSPLSPDLSWSAFSGDGMMWNTIDFFNDPYVINKGVWNNLNHRYMGFQLMNNSEGYYGWIQFNTTASNEITLVDYAYQDVPGAFILAGERAVVPEPATMLLLGSGLAGGFIRRKFKGSK